MNASGSGSGPGESTAGPSGFAHEPVLVDKVTELMAAGTGQGLFVDATLGGAGHSRAVLQRCLGLRLLGLDQDRFAIEAATLALAGMGDRVRVVQCRFDQLATEVAAELARPEVKSSGDGTDADVGRGVVAGVLFDLGVSSPQFDRPERGFTYRSAAPLDMRMDDTQTLTAADVVNTTEEGELAAILRRNADERYAGRIARAIVAARPVVDTEVLAELVRDAIPAPARRRGGHPAKRTFQAIRIEVNAELEVLRPALVQAVEATSPGGRVLAISYHSGEDRIVKDVFRQATTGGCECPVMLPCGCGAVRRANRMTAVTPSAHEIELNPRASSARLRILDVIGPITTRPGDFIG